MAFLRIGVANNHHAALRFVLQTYGHIVEHALANVVYTRTVDGLDRTLVDLARLRWWRRLLHLNGRLAIRGSAVSILNAAGDGVAAGREAGGIKLHALAIADDLSGIGTPRVAKREIARAIGLRGNGDAFAGLHGATIDRAAHGRRRRRRLGRNREIHGSVGRATVTLIHVHGYRSGAGAHTALGELTLVAAALHLAIVRGPGISERIAIGIAGSGLQIDRIARAVLDRGLIRGERDRGWAVDFDGVTIPGQNQAARDAEGVLMMRVVEIRETRH